MGKQSRGAGWGLEARTSRNTREGKGSRLVRRAPESRFPPLLSPAMQARLSLRFQPQVN